jgi:hypothetical protein
VTPPLKTPVSSQDSHTLYETRSNITVVDKSEDNDVRRGRTVQRISKHPNPLAKAESRPRFKNDAAIEVDMREIRKRTHSRASSLSHFNDPTDPYAVLEDNLLEPCPHLPLCSTVTEVLDTPLSSTAANKRARASTDDTSNTTTRHTDIKPPARARRTSSRDSRPLQPELTITHESMDTILPVGRNVESISIKPHAQIWTPPESLATRAVSSKPISLGAQLPTEILQQIFYMLTPVDFNSARRICRVWFISSLELSVLKAMSSRGGWSRCVQRDLAVNQALAPASRINDEWVVSKRLARECTLGPDWTGNGVSDNEDQHSSPKKSGFAHTSTIDFTDVPVSHLLAGGAGTIFTVSTCGKFLMAANGCLVYIYELNRSHDPRYISVTRPGSLRPVTSIICPRRVLACSMDASSRRYAIAVLLDGRMGMVCEIAAKHIAPEGASTRSTHNSADDETSDPSEASLDKSQKVGEFHEHSFLDQVYFDSPGPSFASGFSTSLSPFILGRSPTSATSIPDEYVWRGAIKSYMPEPVQTTRRKSRPSLPRTHVIDPGSRLYSSLPPVQEKIHTNNSMPIEMGPRSLYRSLCSDDDPPRSVAICPQRRCVAFGCSAGIELHWVDALTGQDLSRWFPLTAPSDYLFFLPPRTSIDSAKKLRLISSAASPGERPAISQRIAGRATRNSPFWERLGYGTSSQESNGEASSDQHLISRLRANTQSRVFSGSIDCSDHYRAVPLSDGYHVLFTDPTTGLLCLGSDAPVGGPTKLLRKIWFQGPAGRGSPVAYAGSLDVGGSVRVVAAFDSGSEQSIWFFSVPGDVFAANKGFHFVLGNSHLQTWSHRCTHDNRSPDWVEWWPDRGLNEWLNYDNDPIQGVLPRPVWPVKIRGQEVGVCSALVDLAVHSGPSMTVWAFSRQGIAKVWRINDGNNATARDIWVARDGTVREGDGEGDIEMGDADDQASNLQRVPGLPRTQESFDGTTSCSLVATATTISGQQAPITRWSRCTNDCDSEADIIMGELHPVQASAAPESQARAPESIEAVAFLHHRGGNLYRSSRRSGHSYESIGADFVEGLTGVTRIDVEIR